MPLGETLTLLATLANALQTLRLTRPAEAPHAVEPVIDPIAVMALDLARTANEEAARKMDSALNRLQGLLVLSGAALLISAFLGASSNDSPEASSPLFIASICLFAAVAALAIMLRRVVSLSRFSVDDLSLPLDRALERARDVAARNQGRLTALNIGSDALTLLIAVQVVVAAVWLIS